MRSRTIPVTFCVLLSLWGYSVASGEQYLKNYTIVRADDVTEPETYAASEIAHYIGECVNATMPIISESQYSSGQAIFVGQTVFAANRGIDFDALGLEEWIVQTFEEGPNRQLVITGGRPRGTLYGAYQFLEHECGIRFLSSTIEHVPVDENLELSEIAVRQSPLFRRREVYTVAPAAPDAVWDFFAKRQLGFVGAFKDLKYGNSYLFGSPNMIHTHSYYSVDFPPEYFALLEGGGRSVPGPQGQVCMSNPNVRDEFVAKLKEYIAADRAAGKHPYYYDLTPNDNQVKCVCDDCLALVETYGSYNGVLLDFVNEIAERVAPDYPDITVQTYAYSYYIDPPHDITPADNVVVTVAMLGDEFSSIPPRHDTLRGIGHPRNAAPLDMIEDWAAATGQGWRPNGPRGDFDTDGDVDFWDFMAFVDVYGMANTQSGWPLRGDFDGDGDLDFWDFMTFIDVYGLTETGDMGVHDYWVPYRQMYQWPVALVTGLGGMISEYYANNVNMLFTENLIWGSRIHSFLDLRWYVAAKMMEDPTLSPPAVIAKFMDLYYGPASGKMTDLLNYMETRQDEETGYLATVPPFAMTHFDYDFFLHASSLLDEAEALVSDDPVRYANIRQERLAFDEAALFLLDQLDLPWDRGDLVTRLEAAYSAAYNKYGGFGSAAAAVDQARLAYLADPPPIPDGIAGPIIVDLCYPQLALRYGLADDPDACMGKAYRVGPEYSHTKDPIFGLYGEEDVRKTIEKADVPQDEEYHWYYVGRASPENSRATFWAHSSWALTQRLYMTYNSGLTEQHAYDVYASVKLQGPAYVPGSTSADSLLIDRLILAQVGEPLP